MKTTLLLLLICLSLTVCGSALAKVEFALDAFVGYVGESMNIRVTHDGTDRGKLLTVRNASGAVIAQRELTAAKGFWNIPCEPLTEDAPGTQITLHLNGEDTVLDTALLAIETRPGYSITQVDRDDKKISFTFSAANGAAKTAEILDLLDKYNAKCTFFVIGRYVLNNPELTREIEARGHEVAGHSWDHPDMPSLDNDRVLKDFTRISEAFVETLGHDVRLYRPPSGYSSHRDRAIARALGLEVIKWTIDSRDGFEDTTLGAAVQRVKNKAGSGAIVLMHVYGKHTLAALETLLPWYSDQGYEFVTVSDLLLKGDTVIDEDGVQRYREK